MSRKIPYKVFSNISVLVFAAVFFSIPITSHVQAYEVIADPAYIRPGEAEPETVEQFIRQGKNCYLRNDAQGAIGYFARALLLDPANKAARDSLARISAQTSLPASQRIQLFLSDDLLIFNEKLQEELDYFTAKRDALAAALIQQNYPQTSIDQKLKAIRNRFIPPADRPRKDAGIMSPLETLNKSLIRNQQQMARELLNVREQISWLQPIGSSRETDTQVSRPPKADNAREPWQQIADVREELSELRRQVETLQEDVKHKDDKIAALTKQIVEFSLKLTEREMILNEKVNALSSLHDAYADLQSRQELGQKILEEKNVQIQSLQEGLAALQADTAVHTKEINGLIAAKDQALDQWEKILAIYQGELKDATETIEVRNADVGALQEQLAMVRTKLFEKETALEKTKEKLVSLEKQFQTIVSDPE